MRQHPAQPPSMQNVPASPAEALVLCTKRDEPGTCLRPQRYQRRSGHAVPRRAEPPGFVRRFKMGLSSRQVFEWQKTSHPEGDGQYQ